MFRKVFIFISRLLWEKGLLEYVEAARRVKKIFPETSFLSAGAAEKDSNAGATLKKIREWELDGTISYLGEANDIRVHIAQVHCVVLPSYREGLPRVLLEGAAMGRPLVATDVSGCREVVDDGVNGYLCRVNDSEDLTTKLLKIHSLSMQEMIEMGRKGRKKVETDFDERLVIKQYIELIEGCTPLSC